jgi:hypothetical protein
MVNSSGLECPFHTCNVKGKRGSRPLPPVRGSGLGVHIGAEDGVDAGLVAGVLAEPAEEVSVEADGDDFFGHGHDHPGVFPEGLVGGAGVGVGEEAAAYLGWGQAAETCPVGAGLGLERRSVRL